MKKNLMFGVIGLVVGAFIMMIFIYNAAPGMMLLENQSKYDFEETVTKLTESVEDHGWKIPAIQDLQKSMNKFGIDVLPVQVFELCHPDHAGEILKLSDERIVSTLMPCRVAVYEKPDGKVYLSRMNSKLMAKPMGGIIAKVMSVAAVQNEEILESIILK